MALKHNTRAVSKVFSAHFKVVQRTQEWWAKDPTFSRTRVSDLMTCRMMQEHNRGNVVDYRETPSQDVKGEVWATLTITPPQE